MTTPDPLNDIRTKLAATAAGYVSVSEGIRRPLPAKPTLTRQIVKANSFDVLDWNTVRRDADLHAVIEDIFHGDLLNPENRPGYFNAPELVRDIFMTFFRPYPTLNRVSAVYPDARLNGLFVEQMMALPDYERLHDATMTDPLLAKMATVALSDALKEMIRLNREPVQESNAQRQQQDAQNQAGSKSGQEGEPGDKADPAAGDEPQTGDSEDEADTDGSDGTSEAPADSDGDTEPQEGSQGDESGDGDGQEDSSQLDNGQREFDDGYADAEYGPEANFEDLIDGVDLARHVDLALGTAADELEELQTTRRGIGLEDGEWKSMDPAARLDIAARLNTPLMRAIADLMGRMRRFAFNQQTQKVDDAPQEIFSVGLGNDLNSLLLSEYAFLGHPDTQVEFYRRYAHGTLLQYRHRGHEQIGKGPLLVLIDNSGSMKGAAENWAKGFAEALRRICQEQERDYQAIYFGKNTNRLHFEFPKGKGPFEKVMAFLSVTAAWGTEFDGVLTEGLAKAQTAFDGEGKGKADIVFITDGRAHLGQAWIDQFVAERDRIGARIFGISIAANDTVRTAAVELLEKICSVVIPVQALVVNDDAAATVFSQV